MRRDRTGVITGEHDVAAIAVLLNEGAYSGPVDTLQGPCRMTFANEAQVDVALAVFDFSQRVAHICRASNDAVRREILDAVCLNRVLDDVTLVTTKRRPFDVLAAGTFLEKSRGDSPGIETVLRRFLAEAAAEVQTGAVSASA